MKTLTMYEALELLADVVQEYGPTTTYTERHKAITGKELDSLEVCRNLLPDQHTDKPVPACIIGVVLSKVIPIDAIPTEGAIRGTVAYALTANGHLDLPWSVLGVLDAAQTAQDRGQTWGQALEAARANAHKPQVF